MERLSVSPDYDFDRVVSALEAYHRKVDQAADSMTPRLRPYEPMEYFGILRHLSLRPGWKLDYIDDSSPNGAPRLVFLPRGSTIPGEVTPLAEFRHLDTTQSSPEGELVPRRIDLSPHLVLDGTPESLFELAVFSTLAGQCLLNWHAAYRDETVVRGPNWRPVNREGFGLPVLLPPESDATVELFNYGDFLCVRFLVFTKWGGYYRAEFRIAPNYLANISVTNTVVLPYSCGVLY